MWLKFECNLITSDKLVHPHPQFGESTDVQHVIHVCSTGQPFFVAILIIISYRHDYYIHIHMHTNVRIYMYTHIDTVFMCMSARCEFYEGLG